MLSGRLTRLALAFVGILSAGTAGAQGGDLPPNNLPNDYITVLNWAKIPDGRRWGSTAGIDVAPDGSIWAYDRCGANSCVDLDLDPILHFDPSGRLLGSFGAGLFNVPHGLHGRRRRQCLGHEPRRRSAQRHRAAGAEVQPAR